MFFNVSFLKTLKFLNGLTSELHSEMIFMYYFRMANSWQLLNCQNQIKVFKILNKICSVITFLLLVFRQIKKILIYFCYYNII